MERNSFRMLDLESQNLQFWWPWYFCSDLWDCCVYKSTNTPTSASSSYCTVCAPSVSPVTEGLLSEFLTNMRRTWMQQLCLWNTGRSGASRCWAPLVPCQWEPGSSRRVGKEPFPGDTGGTEAPERLLWTIGDEYQGKGHDQGLRPCFSWQKQDIGISWGCRTGQWASAQSLGEEEASPSAAASAAGWWKTSEGLQLKCAEFCYKSSLKGVGI